MTFLWAWTGRREYYLSFFVLNVLLRVYEKREDQDKMIVGLLRNSQPLESMSPLQSSESHTHAHILHALPSPAKESFHGPQKKRDRLRLRSLDPADT